MGPGPGGSLRLTVGPVAVVRHLMQGGLFPAHTVGRGTKGVGLSGPAHRTLGMAMSYLVCGDQNLVCCY